MMSREFGHFFAKFSPFKSGQFIATAGQRGREAAKDKHFACRDISGGLRPPLRFCPLALKRVREQQPVRRRSGIEVRPQLRRHQRTHLRRLGEDVMPEAGNAVVEAIA